MVQKKQKFSKGPNHGKFENDPHLSERIIILLFLIFTITSVIILLKGMPDSVFLTATSFATGGLTLDNNHYEGNNPLQGTFVFTLDPRDVLPANSTFIFSIMTNATKCSLKYSCSPKTSSTVNWYAINATTGTCNLIEPDPEGECCLKQGADCPQVILNKDFDDGTNKWTANAGKAIINTETLRWTDENDERVVSVVMFQDGSKFSGGAFNFSLLQTFDARKIRMKEEKTPAVPTSCLDSDGGNVSTVFGICEGKYSDGTTTNNPDTCKTNTLLKESYCEDKKCKDTYYACPSGRVCANGECVIPGNPINSCFDTDGGIRPNVKGRVFMNYSNKTNVTYTDTCVLDYENAQSSMTPENQNIFQKIIDLVRKITGMADSNIVLPGNQQAPTSHTVLEYFCQNPSTKDSTRMTCGSGICTNGACPVIEYVEFENAKAALNDVKINWSVAWQQIEDVSEPCAFEVIVSSNTSRSLHYYYPLAKGITDMYECSGLPNGDNNNKYIRMSLGGSDPYEEIKIWDKVNNIYLITDWKSKFTNTENDYINEVKVVSKKRTRVLNGATTVFGQKIFVEYVNIFKSDVAPETNCTAAGKKCCLAGTGFGAYYGDQLNCSTDYECWGSCTDKSSLKLTQLFSKSVNGNIRNRTSDKCQAWVDGIKVNGEEALHDYCSDQGVGKGYTLAYDIDGQPVAYTLNLSDISLDAPNQNGTYSLRIRYQYIPSPASYQCSDAEGNELSSCLIFEKYSTFIVGSGSNGGGGGGCTSNWVNTTNWGDCINNVQWRTEEDTQRCEGNYIRNVSKPCGCAVIWGNCAWQLCQGTDQEKLCSDTTCSTGTTNVTETRACCTEQWEPSEGDCINGAKTRTYTDINSCGTTFNIVNDETIPCTSGSNIFKAWWFWVIVVIILLGLFVFLLMTVLKKKPKTKVGKSESIRASSKSSESGGSSGENSEIVAYINEATASGLGKEDIKAKLTEAGWPDDVIEKSFLDAGM